MFYLPKFRELTTKSELLSYAAAYTICSGLPVPEAFILSPTNQVFGLYVKGDLIGGFILGHGPDYRTIALFANESARPALSEQFSTKDGCTEICCFFIAPEYRAKTIYNFATWASMIYAQVRHGRKTFLYGTCSRSLAKLYGQTKKSVLIHEDVVNGKSTFIFRGEKRYCIGGMLRIMSHKLQRIMAVAKRGKRRMVQG